VSADDLRSLRRRLSSFEAAAARLPWSAERPWRTESHLWWEGSLLVVDLHDLSVKLALAVVGASLATELQTDQICFITGVGKHSRGPSPLRQAVLSLVQDFAEERGSTVHIPRGGRVIVPLSAPRGIGWGLWLLWGILGAAALVAFWPILSAIFPFLPSFSR
jgi:hypothetical protein